MTHPLRASLLAALAAALGTGAGGCASGGSAAVYEGTYVRTWVELDGSIGQVTGPVRLELDGDGAYAIEGERFDHPPKGRGHYRRPGDGTLVFEDRAFSTAGFDLSLVLGGTFEAAEEGTALVLTQENTWGHTHHLVLARVSGGEGETGDDR